MLFVKINKTVRKPPVFKQNYGSNLFNPNILLGLLELSQKSRNAVLMTALFYFLESILH